MSASGTGHEHIEELIAAEALGGLDESDRGLLELELAKHGPDCEECGRLLVEYGQAAADLALALEPVPLSPGAEDRLMDLARGERAPVVRLGRMTRPRRWFAPAGVAAALLVAAGFLGYALAPSRPNPTRVVTLATGAQVLQVAYRPGERQGLVVGSNLPDAPQGKVYELWYQPSKDAGMAPAGTFVPTNGTVAAPVKLGSSFVALAVSLEPPGGSPHPTSSPIYLRSA
jgi:anti-sigma-K factor RskA